jgi:hypothetical protein
VVRTLTNAILCGAFRSNASPDAATAAAAAAQYGERLRQLSDPSSSPVAIPHPHMAALRDQSTEERSESTASPIGSTGIASVPHVCSPRRRAVSPPSSRLRDDDDRSWPRVTQMRYAAPGPLRPAGTPAEPRRGRAKRMNMGKEVHVSSMVMTAWRLVAIRLLGPGCQMTSREPLNPDRTMYLYSTCAPTPPLVGQSSQAQRLGLRADAG